METKRLYSDSHGIHIILPSRSEYFIAWWQIAKDGVAKWLHHLREKNWFSTEHGLQFSESCTLHFHLN